MMNFASRRALAEHLAFDAPKCAVALLGQPRTATAAACDLLNSADLEAATKQKAEGKGRWRPEFPAFRKQGNHSQFELELANITDEEARATLVECDYAFSPEAAQEFCGLTKQAHRADPPPQDDRFWPFRPQDFSGIAAEALPFRIRRPEFFVLNLFSGMRRSGDIQWHLEFSWPASTCAVYCLSIDVAIDAIRGDLTQQDIILEWVGHVAARRVLNTGGGPLRNLERREVVRRGAPSLAHLGPLLGSAMVHAPPESPTFRRSAAFGSAHTSASRPSQGGHEWVDGASITCHVDPQSPDLFQVEASGGHRILPARFGC